MKHKTLLCILLVILIGISGFSMTFHLISADASTTPILSVVPTGDPGATVNSTQIPAVAVGSTFTVDIRIDNIGSVTPGINGLSYNLTYNPSVLKISADHSKQASFWGATSSDVASIITQIPGILTESALIVPSGAPNEATNTPGVATQITFTVLAAGQSNISFAPSDVGVAYLCYPDSAGNSHDVVANTVDALYGSSAGLVYGPTANFTPADGSSFAVGSTVNLDASSSQPGFDAQTCNITNYSWSVEYFNGTTFTSLTGETATFKASVDGIFRIILIVTANDTQVTHNPEYISTNSTSALINVVSSLQSVNFDVFTNQGGIGPGASGGLYGPLQLVQIYASMTDSNGLPITDQNVLFTIQNSNSTVIAVIQGVTNETGLASCSFRLPTPDPNAPQNNFGKWSITATANVTGTLVSDTANFIFSYQSGIENVTIPTSVQISETLPIQLTINNQQLSSQLTQLSITIFDQAGIPIGSTTIATTQQTQNITVIDAAITIPPWAYTGQATAYFCLLTNTTNTQYIPIAPETSVTFQIMP